MHNIIAPFTKKGLQKTLKAMKNHFTKEKIIKVLKKHEVGRLATDIVREGGIAEQTFYSWKRKYGDMNGFLLFFGKCKQLAIYS